MKTTTTTTAAEAPDTSRIDPAVVKSDFVQQLAPKPLRVCCYGSSASSTPEMYMKEARSLGYILGKRGHTCVNGAGAFGCMAAMNDGACAGDGHIVGVIHEMWLPKKKKEKNPSSSSAATVTIDALRDGGAHPVFESIENSNASSTAANTATSATPVADSNATSKSSTKKKNRSPRSSLNDYPKREMLVAGGKDLQERKRLLVDKADALVVLPGGTGTWDELWEMACARGIGLTKIPIVCVNCDGFYEPFREMLIRAHKDKLTKLQPHELVHFEATAEGAVRWIEATVQNGGFPPTTVTATANTKSHNSSSVLRMSSFLHSPVLGRSDSCVKKSFWSFTTKASGLVNEQQPTWILRSGLAFAAGVALGAVLASGRFQRRG